MTESVDAERAYYFQDLTSRVIARAAALCRAAGDGLAIRQPQSNLCGDDLEQADLDLIEAVMAGRCAGLTPWREAQVCELAFWRWVAFEGVRQNQPTTAGAGRTSGSVGWAPTGEKDFSTSDHRSFRRQSQTRHCSVIRR